MDNDEWQTPPEVITYIEKHFGTIETDCAATALNAVCDNFIDEKMDFLNASRIKPGLGFLHPPSSNSKPFIDSAIGLTRSGNHIITLLNMDTSTKGFKLIYDNACEVMPIVGGRLALLDSNGKPHKDNHKAQMLVYFRPNLKNHPSWHPIRIEDIYC